MIKTKLQLGVSLIEILITTLVLGVGLLGVAALQVSSISSNQEGFFTSQATSIAEDYASRVRSGRLVTAVPEFDSDDSATTRHINYVNQYVTDGVLECESQSDLEKMCRSAGGDSPESCSVSEIVAFDKWEVCDATKNTLPDGQIRAARVSGRLTVVVDWSPTSSREDIGTVENINSNCSTLGVDESRNCVIVELIP